MIVIESNYWNAMDQYFNYQYMYVNVHSLWAMLTNLQISTLPRYQVSLIPRFLSPLSWASFLYVDRVMRRYLAFKKLGWGDCMVLTSAVLACTRHWHNALASPISKYCVIWQVTATNMKLYRHVSIYNVLQLPRPKKYKYSIWHSSTRLIACCWTAL